MASSTGMAAGSYKSKSGTSLARAVDSGRPEVSSSATALARAQVSATNCVSEASEKSEVDVLADRFPKNARMPRLFSRALLKQSTADNRTWTDTESPSATMTSASVAPWALTRSINSAARVFRTSGDSCMMGTMN